MGDAGDARDDIAVALVGLAEHGGARRGVEDLADEIGGEDVRLGRPRCRRRALPHRRLQRLGDAGQALVLVGLGGRAPWPWSSRRLLALGGHPFGLGLRAHLIERLELRRRVAVHLERIGAAVRGLEGIAGDADIGLEDLVQEIRCSRARRPCCRPGAGRPCRRPSHARPSCRSSWRLRSSVSPPAIASSKALTISLILSSASLVHAPALRSAVLHLGRRSCSSPGTILVTFSSTQPKVLLTGLETPFSASAKAALPRSVPRSASCDLAQLDVARLEAARLGDVLEALCRSRSVRAAASAVFSSGKVICSTSRFSGT